LVACSEGIVTLNYIFKDTKMLIFWGDLRLLSQILSVDTALEDATILIQFILSLH